MLFVCAALALDPRTVAVIGASGNLGRKVVERLVSDGHTVRCLSRRPGRQPPQPNVQEVPGDVTDVASLEALMTGCCACLAVHGARRSSKLADLWTDAEQDKTHSRWVNLEGVRNIIAAGKATNCTRIVRVTGKGESPWSVFSILINGLGSFAKAYNYEGEALLRASDVDYTIVRPGVMKEQAPSSLALADDGRDLKVAPVSYAAIADLCVDCLDFPNTKRATLCAMTGGDATATTWSPLLSAVQPDRRAFAPSLLKEHKRAVALGGPALLALVAGFLSVVCASFVRLASLLFR